jgi:hypothetical protein
VWPREFELPPERRLRAPLHFGDWRERQRDGTVGEVRPGDDILDAVENDGRAAANSTSSRSV